MMQHTDRFVSEYFIHILRAFSEDDGLRRWFVSLQDVSENIRVSMLGAMISKMKANKEAPELIAEFELLLYPDTFAAAVKTVLNFKEY